MDGKYDVFLVDKPVGNVLITKQGLYYKLQCTCCMAKTGMYRLMAKNSADEIRFGILIPEGDQMVLETSIPIKKLPKDVSFYLQSLDRATKQQDEKNYQGKYAPVYPDEPFEYIAKLKQSYLEIRNGQPGLVFRS